MIIKDNGNVGIGTPSPAAKLDVNGHTVIRGTLSIGNGGTILTSNPDGAGIFQGMALRWADGYTGFVPAERGFYITKYKGEGHNLVLYNDHGDLWIRGNYSSASDSRIKPNQEPLDYGLTEVLKLQPMRFVWVDWTMDQETGGIEINEATGETDFGLIAQDVYEIMPEAVKKPEDESTEYWGLAYDKLIAVLAKAIQEQQAQIEELKKEIQAIKSGI